LQPIFGNFELTTYEHYYIEIDGPAIYTLEVDELWMCHLSLELKTWKIVFWTTMKVRLTQRHLSWLLIIDHKAKEEAEKLKKGVGEQRSTHLFY